MDKDYKRLKAADLRPYTVGRWLELIPAIAPGIFDEALEKLGHHVTCPFHGGSGDFRFIKVGRQGRGNTADTGVAMCSCGVFSDGFELLQKATGMSFIEVLQAIASHLGLGQKGFTAKLPPPLPPPKPQPTEEELAAIQQELMARVAKLWSAGKPFNYKEFSYYCTRGINPLVLADLKDVRTLESLGYYVPGQGGAVKQGSYPAILAAMRGPDEELLALHRTWLSVDKQEKAPVEKAKKLTTTPGVVGAAIRLFDATGADTLGLTEGVETALAARQLAMGGYWQELGEIPVWACFAERNVRNFQIPASVKETLRKVVVFADNDANNKGLEAAMAFKDRMASENPDLEVDIKLPPVAGWDWLDVLVNL